MQANEYLQLLWLAGVPISSAIHSLYKRYNIVLSGHALQQYYDHWERQYKEKQELTYGLKVYLEKIKKAAV